MESVVGPFKFKIRYKGVWLKRMSILADWGSLVVP